MPTPFLGSATAVDMTGLLTHTTQWIEKKGVIQDAIFSANPLFHELRANKRIKSSAPGGTHEQVNLLYGANNTFGSYRGYDVLPNDPQDGMTCAYYPWAQYAITVSIDGLTTLQNAGSAKIKDLISSKMTQATMTIAEGMNGDLLDATVVTADTGNNGKNLIPLPMLVDSNPARNRAVAAINGNSRDWWRNQAVDYTSYTNHTATIFKRALSIMYNTCTAAGKMGGAPNIILMDQSSFENYEASIEPQRRYQTDAKAQAGFPYLHFRNAKVIWDDRVQDAYADGGTTLGAIYFINTNFMDLRILGGRDWKWGSWEKPIDQDARQNTSLWAGQLVVSNRRKHGVIHRISKAPFS